jgi:hypothetical protein
MKKGNGSGRRIGGSKSSQKKGYTLLATTEKIEHILQLYKTDKATASTLIEEEARRIWLGYLFQSHKEVKEITEIEEVEKRIYDPQVGEIVEVSTTKRKKREVITPKTPYWAIKAALVRWENLSNFEELNAIQLLTEIGIFPEDTLELMSEHTSGVPKALKNAREQPLG